MNGNRPGAKLSVTPAILVLVLAGCGGAVPTTPEPTAPSAPTTPAPSGTPQPSPSDAPNQPSEPGQPGIAGWQAADVPASRNASGMQTILPGGDGWVAVGFDGGFGSTVWTSTDGRAWRDVTPAGFEAVGIIDVVDFDGKLVAVGRGNTIDIESEEAAVYLSTDGLEWRKVETSEQLIGQMIDVIATDDGLYAVGGVPGADAAGVWHSPDGETWTRTGPDIEHAFMWAITEGGPGLVAVGWRRNPDPSAAVWTSTDGAEWTLSPDPEGFELYEGTDVLATDDGMLVMVGSSFTTQGGQIWTSSDGLTWTLAEVDGGMEGVYARTAIEAGGRLVAVGGGEAMDAHAWQSTDGRVWESIGEPLPGAFFHAAHATDDVVMIAGATQAGSVETGIQAHAQIWIATPAD